MRQVKLNTELVGRLATDPRKGWPQWTKYHSSQLLLKSANFKDEMKRKEANLLFL